MLLMEGSSNLSISNVWLLNVIIGYTSALIPSASSVQLVFLEPHECVDDETQILVDIVFLSYLYFII
jgi:hypothetical protein